MNPVESRELEREYVLQRPAVLAMLREEFRSVPDHEELYQEAWTEALELRARGGEIANLRALLKKIAWRRARDRARNLHALAVDPTGDFLSAQKDVRPAPDEEALVHIDAAIARRIIESLEPRHAAVLKMRFEEQLDGEEMMERLGVSRKRLEKIVTKAYKCVEAQIEASNGGDSASTRRLRSLLLACEMGLASPAQKERAQLLLLEDPRCRAMLREMRATLERVAGLLPVPVVVERRDRFSVPVWDRFSELAAWARDQVASVASRFGGQASTVEQATAGGAAGLGGATAAKIVAVCLATAGGAAVCVESGLLGGGDPAPPAAKASTREPRDARPVPARTAVPATRSTSRRTTKRKTTATKSSRSHEKAPASPAPGGASEFSFEQTAPAGPPQPAVAPATGGGEFTP